MISAGVIGFVLGLIVATGIYAPWTYHKKTGRDPFAPGEPFSTAGLMSPDLGHYVKEAPADPELPEDDDANKRKGMPERYSW